MVIVRRLLQVLIKPLQTTLAIAQRIVRFLQSTFRHNRSWRETWKVAETLLRSLSPEVEHRVDQNTHRTEEEDEFEVANNRLGEQISTRREVETLSSSSVRGINADKDTEGEVMITMKSSSGYKTSGKCSIVVLSTIMEMSEEDDTDKV